MRPSPPVYTVYRFPSFLPYQLTIDIIEFLDKKLDLNIKKKMSRSSESVYYTYKNYKIRVSKH